MGVAVVLALLVIGSVAFHVLSPWWWTPIASNWRYIDTTIIITFWITGFVFAAVVLFMAYCVFRFRHRDGTAGSLRTGKQAAGMVARDRDGIGVAAMLAPGLVVWKQFVTVPADAATVEVVGQQWQWSFRLPGRRRPARRDRRHRLSTPDNPLGLDPERSARGQDDVIIEGDDLHLPLGKPVKVLLRSIDVLHDFYVPRVPRQDGHDPGQRHLFLVHADPDRHLRDPLRRTLRRRPSADARLASSSSRRAIPAHGCSSRRPSRS